MSTGFQVCLTGGAPWGFRLHGGKEFRAPLRIAKVEVNGKAYGAGVRLGDKVIEINGRDVQNLYHTEALVLVKRATDELKMMVSRERVDEGQSRDSAGSPQFIQQKSETSEDSMIKVKAYKPAATVSVKPLSPTSVPVPYDVDEEGDVAWNDYDQGKEKMDEWSPDIINDVTRIPDPISINRDQNTTRQIPEASRDISYDMDENRRKTPQAPTSPHGFEKVRPTGRGRRRLTSSGSSSLEKSIDDDTQGNTEEVFPIMHDSDESHVKTNSALRHLQHNKAEADPYYNIPRTSSLPRSLGKKHNQAKEQKSMTLPRKKSEPNRKQSITPSWYKDMYREINKSMEGQSHLSRLLTADAAKGAFRTYDGASSPRSVSPNDLSRRRQRPKSIHIDRFQFDVDGMQDARSSRDDSTRNTMEKREKRHSVHSSWYREFQKGGELPPTGLATDPSKDTLHQPIHTRSRSTDDVLSKPSKGLPYQTPDQRSPETRLTNPTKFEYNNPPDFLELRKKAEDEGALREERERELRMLQEERQKWLQEEEELKIKQMDTKKKNEEEKQRRILQQREWEEQRMREQEEMERARQEELRRNKGNKMNGFRSIDPVKKIENEIRVGKAKALYSFQAQSPSEISFKKGQTIDVIRQIDENWYEGEVHGQIGIFPSNYVEKKLRYMKGRRYVDRDERENHLNRRLIKEEKYAPEPSEEMPAPTIQIEEGLAKGRYAFQAENDKELSFRKNDMITVLRQLDDNWYEGELGNQIGIFPVAYVEMLREPKIFEAGFSQPAQSEESIIDSHQNLDDKQRVAKQNVITSSQVVSNDPPREEIQLASSHHTISSQEVVEVDAPAGERHRAIFGYTPMNEDEVEILEGDTVFVLEKCDDGWFVGVCERTGKFGTFPGNYVVPA